MSGRVCGGGGGTCTQIPHPLKKKFKLTSSWKSFCHKLPMFVHVSFRVAVQFIAYCCGPNPKLCESAIQFSLLYNPSICWKSDNLKDHRHKAHKRFNTMQNPSLPTMSRFFSHFQNSIESTFSSFFKNEFFL